MKKAGEAVEAVLVTTLAILLLPVTVLLLSFHWLTKGEFRPPRKDYKPRD